MAIRPSVEYVDPLVMLEAAERQMSQIPGERLFNDSKHKKLLESWCAGMFGYGYATYTEAACQVAVNDTTQRMDADFFLMSGNREWDFQLAEVQEAGRKRGAEYNEFASGERRTVGYDPDQEVLEGADWLKAAALRKKAKRYASSDQLNLLLYANFDDMAHHDQLVARLGSFSNDFASLWIITSDHLCSVFSSNDLKQIPGWWKFRQRRAVI